MTPTTWNALGHQARTLGKWLLVLTPVMIVIGSAVAFFLWSLDQVTRLRFARPWLLYFLPLAGMGVGFLYWKVGDSVEKGNNLILEQIHEPGGGVPRRMAPLILLATLVTHLFGGSAGREGTAVQMAGSLAGTFARWFPMRREELRLLLMAGIAGGFGAVFGTPLAGTVFALEVLILGRMQYEALLPCLFAAILGNEVCQAWGIRHAHYQIHSSIAGGPGSGFPLLLMAKIVVASIAFGLAGTLFSEVSHGLQKLFRRLLPFAPARPLLGGVLVITLVFIVGSRDYLGLSVDSPDPNAVTLASFFQSDTIHYWSWWWKLLFTALTLSSGFKGGEVTPLFFIGAALGNALAGVLHAPPDLLAALGFVAVFAGAANTPLACTFLGMELFGAAYGPYFAMACFLAYFFSGHSGIYAAQKVGMRKGGPQRAESRELP